MSDIKSFRDLIVWQKAMSLARLVYTLTRRFPKEEQYGLSFQMRRAVVSIPSNIAEGNGRGSKPDYARFLQIARGSLYETQTQLELSRDLGFVSTEDVEQVLTLGNEIERMLNALIAGLGS